MKFIQAIERPRLGFANANKQQDLAITCEAIAENTAISRVALYNWAKRHKVESVRLYKGYASNQFSVLDLLAAVLNDENPEWLFS